MSNLWNSLKQMFSDENENRRQGHRLTVEALEDRMVLSTMGTTLNPVPLTVVNTNDSGAGSLRQAILDANAAPGTDLIHFAISGTDTQVIALESALPEITDSVVIDGHTQEGARANTLDVGNNAQINIVLDGSGSTFGSGLVLTAGSSTVRGLQITDFGSYGIVVSQTGMNNVAGNFIPGNRNGIVVSSSANLIGGSSAADRNVISGNDEYGLVISGSDAVNNQVANNYVGTNPTGDAADGNGIAGVLLFAAAENNVIGTNGDGVDDAHEGNLISGNDVLGVTLLAPSSDLSGSTNVGGANYNVIVGTHQPERASVRFSPVK